MRDPFERIADEFDAEQRPWANDPLYGGMSEEAKRNSWYAAQARKNEPSDNAEPLRPRSINGSSKTASTPTADAGVSLETMCASDAQLKAIDWLWPNRFALGKLGLLAGLPDRGKGLITADMIARITNKQLNDWPCGEGKAPFGSVIVLSAEDDIEDTIVPRLIAAGADLHRVHIVRMATKSDGTKRTFSVLTDLRALRQKIEEIGDGAA